MKDQNLIEFGERIKEIRKVLKISQQDFAKSIDVAVSSLSEFEAGKTKPTFYFFFNISRNHGVNLKYLLHGEGEIFDLELDSHVKDMLDHFDIPEIRLLILEEFDKIKRVFKPIIEANKKNNKEDDD